jgi:DtxR family Mn-dependent transcriptional regulator
MPAAGEHHPAFEEYCECIFELQEDDVDVIQARIAERLQVSRPAVSEMMRRLEHEGLISTDGGIRLTSAGHVLAERVVRRHRLAERFLTDILELSWAEAHHEAGKWEHVMSANVEQAIDRLLGSPTTCPHGNPIPGSDYIPPDATPLSQIDVGRQFTISRIPEELEFTPGLLEFLEESELVPGTNGTVTAISPDGTLTLEIGGHHVGRVRECAHPGQRVTRSRRAATASTLLVAGLVALGCATEIDPTATTVAPGSTTSSTVFVAEGTMSELLGQLVEQARGLSETIVENEGDEALLERLNTIWDAARPAVEAAAPDLIFEFDRAIEMMNRAVERRRHADADKALNNLRNLIAALPVTVR